MRRPKKDIQLTSYDELLGLEETPEKSMNQVVEIDLAKLYPFKNHPFHVNDDEKMAETVESIKTYGVLTPALVRPRPDGGYEMISGHRRKRGCELCGKTTLPALVRNYTDDEAVIIMVDSNIQRENLLPSEKAHAYKMKYDGSGKVPAFELIQTIETSAKKDVHDTHNAASGLSLANDGKHLFCTTAGEDTVSMFERDEETGMLTRKFTLPISGEYPKDLVLLPDDKHLVLANHASNTLTTFTVDYEKNIIVMNGKPIKITEPNCIRIWPVPEE